MGTTAPDAVKRLVDHFDQNRKVVLTDWQLMLRRSRGPSLADSVRSRLRLVSGGQMHLTRLVLCLVLLVVTLASGRKADWTIYLPDSLSCLASPRCVVYDPANNTVYVGGGAFVIAVDCSTNKKVARMATGSCGALFYNPANNRVYCLGNPVTVIDGTSNTVIDTIGVSGGGGFCYNSRKNKFYFFSSNRGNGTVTVVDVLTKAIVASISVGQFPTALCYNSQDNRVYCANSESQTVAVIDGAADSVIETVSVGNRPSALCYNPIGNKVYCANSRESTLTVIDGSTSRVLATVVVGQGPHVLLHCGRNNKVYCANAGTRWRTGSPRTG